MKIAYPLLSYEAAFQQGGIPTLKDRRIDLTRLFFEKNQNPEDKLNQILPEKRDIKCEKY